MIEIIMNLLQKIKKGFNYNKLIKQSINEYLQTNNKHHIDDTKLINGAKITHVAQTTFHTIK